VSEARLEPPGLNYLHLFAREAEGHMGAGESAAERGASAARAAEVLRRKAEHAERAARRYQKGSEGERLLVEMLRPLEFHGFRMLADCSVPGAVSNIDLIVVGPPGVFVIDAKNWSGQLATNGTTLLHNGRSCRQEVEKLEAQAAAVAQALRTAGSDRVPVWPILAFVGEATVPDYHLLERCYITGGAAVADLLRAAAPALDPTWLDWVHSVLNTSLPPRTAELAGPSRAPEEPVLFLTPWFRYGKRRRYARDENGNDGGYLDLVDGVVVSDSPVAEQVLGQLLPHYADQLGEVGLSEHDGGIIKRFLSGSRRNRPLSPTPLVVGYEWRKSGMWRLYVNRFGADGLKQELGWFDLQDSRAYSEGGFDAQVRYCGEKYLAYRRSRTSR
jgi:hypothetical protein